MNVEKNPASRPGAILVQEGRSRRDRAALAALAGALAEAGVEVETVPDRQGRQIQRALFGQRPGLLIATGASSAGHLRLPALMLGCPLVVYQWPEGPLTDLLQVTATRMVVASPAARRLLADGGMVPVERIHVLPPAIDTDRMAPGPSRFRAARKQQTAVAGVLHGSPVPALADLGCQIEPLDGNEDDEDLLDLMRGLDVVVIPAGHDPKEAPRLCALALSCGNPVLCEDEAPLGLSWPRHLPGTHRRILEVAPGPELPALLAHYLVGEEGRVRRQRLGEAARNFALSALHTPVVLRQHVELLLEVMEERAQASLAKRVVRQAVARVSTAAGSRLRQLSRGPRTISLAYHQVRDEMRGWDPYMLVNRSSLERQVRALQRRGYTGVTMARQAAQVLGDMDPGLPLDQPTFAITFDDGYSDTLELAAPVLASLQVPFTVYVITDVLSGRLRAPWYDIAAQAVLCQEVQPRTLPLLRNEPSLRPLLQTLPPSPALARQVVLQMKAFSDQRRQALIDEICRAAGEALYAATPRYLDVAQVRRLHEEGVEIASHTQTHPMLPQLEEEALLQELTRSRAYLVDLLGTCQGLAYPNGDSDARVQAAAQVAGYLYAVAVTMQRDGQPPRRYQLGRRMISELSSAGLDRSFDERVFLARVSGYLG